MGHLDAYHAGMTQHYVAFGRLMSSWDHLEQECGMLFVALNGRHRMAQRNFFAPSSFATRHAMLERCLELAENVPTKQIGKAIDRAKVFASKRNDIAHGIWVAVSPSEVIRVAVKTDINETASFILAYLNKKDQKKADKVYDISRLNRLSQEMDAHSLVIASLYAPIFKELDNSKT